MITIKIYKLINPVNGSVFYVGKTVGELKTRLSSHLKDIESNRNKMEVIQSILKEGLIPIIEEIESSTYKNDEEEKAALLREDFWIKEYSKKYDLTNGVGINNPRLLRNYSKVSTKSKPMSIRFNEKEFEFIKRNEGLSTAQEVISFLMKEYMKLFV